MNINMIEKVCKTCDVVARAGILAIMALTVIDVLLRSLANKPVPGSYDLISCIQVAVVALALPYCCFQKANISVDMFMIFLPKRIQRIVDSIIGLISTAFIVVVVWQCILYANNARKAGEVSMGAFIPHYPFIYLVAFGCALLCVVMFSQTVESIKGGTKG